MNTKSFVWSTCFERNILFQALGKNMVTFKRQILKCSSYTYVLSTYLTQKIIIIIKITTLKKKPEMQFLVQ